MWYWIFVKETTKKYLVLKELDIGDEDTFIWDKLEDDGYKLFNANMKSYKQANSFMKEFHSEYKPVKFTSTPITFKTATEFINKYHRHHIAPQGHKFTVAISDGDMIVGVGIAGRPVSRYKDDGDTLEVTRCCVKEGYKNLCSKIYSSIIKIAKELGYKKVITYTLEEEIGTTLNATGFSQVNISPGGSWSSLNRKRENKHPMGRKKVWELVLAD